MTFQLDEMLNAEEPVARVVVADTRGSVPREIGASMLVWPDRITGTIGGGALEFEAIERARTALEEGIDRLDRLPLGPGLGQCCGGAVTLLTEVWDAQRLSAIDGPVARPMPGGADEMPISVVRQLAAARGEGVQPDTGILDGWMVEPIVTRTRDVWIWGAGHVGRAVVAMVAQLPGMQVSWIDTDRTRFPDDIPKSVQTLTAANPADLVTFSGREAEHYVLTFSHALDLEICHRVLGQHFHTLGLIGSATKRARFRKRLQALGHSPVQIDRMQCPIGDPSLGKHPQAIALGVATELVRRGVVGANHMQEQRA